MNSLELKIKAIEERNSRVELDKKWETSWTRRISIAFLTYAVVVSYLTVVDNDQPLINGLVPVVGYLLSTLVLKTIRNLWQN